MSELLDRVRAVLAARTPRERLLLGVGALVLALFILIVGVIAPAQRARADAVAGYAEAARTLGVVQRAAAAPAAPTGGGGPLRAVVSQRAEAAGLVIDRYDSSGDDLRVALADAPAPQLFAWLTELRAEGITVAEAQLRREEAGGVSARLTLRRG